jgi:hypothetical protein
LLEIQGVKGETVSLENFVEKVNQLDPAGQRLCLQLYEEIARKWLHPLLGPLTPEGLVPWATAVKLIAGGPKPERAELQFRRYFETPSGTETSFQTPKRLKSFITPRKGDAIEFLNQRSITWDVVQDRYKNGFPLRDLFGWVSLISKARQKRKETQWQTYLKKGPKRKFKK